MFGGYEAAIRTALRRGATHNLLTDLLVAYGLVGCVLFLVTYFSIARFLWVIRARGRLSEAGSDLALACVVLWLLNFVLEVVGAGSVRVELVWMMIVLIAAVYYGTGVGEAPAQPAAAKVPIDRPHVGHRRFARPALRQPRTV
jgi:O-antigen ligase